jgi:hypothetical protein
VLAEEATMDEGRIAQSGYVYDASDLAKNSA